MKCKDFIGKMSSICQESIMFSMLIGELKIIC